MSQNVIELNGKRYDAITGAYLGKGAHKSFHIASHGRVIDGFVRPMPKAPAESAPKTTAHHDTTIQPIKHTDAAATHRQQHQPPRHAKAHAPQHAKTLMRRAVHKPEVSLKPAIKTQAPAEIMGRPHTMLMHKPSALSVDPSRLERAGHIAQHKAVRHFHPAQRQAAVHVTRQVVVPVKSAPLAGAQPRPQPGSHTDIFEAAIAHATSHEQPHHKPRRAHRRLVNTLAIVGTFLIIGGFIGYLNLPGIELRVASMQAGFHASMPGYTPTGYALQGGIKRSGGTVSLSFRSGDSSYTITQQASDWNSQTLLDNTLALNGSHDTIQKNGQTIYLYGNGANASWVNGGVRYDVTGNAQLSDDDVAAIATSL